MAFQIKLKGGYYKNFPEDAESSYNYYNFVKVFILVMGNFGSGRPFLARAEGVSSKIFRTSRTPHFNFSSKFCFATVRLTEIIHRIIQKSSS